MVWEYFRPGSSVQDWCEPNYVKSPYIAEFVNIISSGVNLIIPAVLIYLFKDYGRLVTKGIHILWVQFIFIGLCSIYYHITLSMLGQRLDEMASPFLFMTGYTLFLPKERFPGFCKGDRRIFNRFMAVFIIIVTGLACWKPHVNALVVMIVNLTCLLTFYGQMKEAQDQRIHRLGVHALVAFALAMICWLGDYMYCDFCTSIGFPYLHALYHVFVFSTVYYAIVVYAYLRVERELPELKPHLKYWPVNKIECTIPYISISIRKRK